MAIANAPIIVGDRCRSAATKIPSNKKDAAVAVPGITDESPKSPAAPPTSQAPVSAEERPSAGRRPVQTGQHRHRDNRDEIVRANQHV